MEMGRPCCETAEHQMGISIHNVVPPAWDRDTAADLKPDVLTSSRKRQEYTGPGSQGTATNGDTLETPATQGE